MGDGDPENLTSRLPGLPSGPTLRQRARARRVSPTDGSPSAGTLGKGPRIRGPRMWPRARAGGILCLSKLFLLMLAVSPAFAKDFQGTFRFGPVPKQQITSVAAKEPIVARLRAGEELSLLSRDIAAEVDAVLVFGVSADFIYFAVSSGSIVAEGQSVPAGKVAFWSPQGGVQVAYYDAERLIDTLGDSLSPDILASLEEVRDAQASLIYWGLLTDDGGNLQASTPAPIEIERRSYLSHPTVMELRFNAVDGDTLARDVASVFVRGLSERDVDLVSALIHPIQFITAADNGVSPAALARRYEFAAGLIAARANDLGSGDRARLKDGGIWSAGRSLTFKLRPGDDFLFVDPASLQPE